MEPVTIIAALGAIAAWLKLVTEEKATRRAEKQRAVEAIYKAATATRSYVNHVKPPVGRGKHARNRKREEELSHVWIEAYVALSRISPDLAAKCEIKSGYWSNPGEWSRDQITRAGIELDTIFELAGELRGKRRTA